MANKATKTETLADIAKVCHQSGDTLNDMFKETKDLKVIQLALKSYNTVISCKKTELINKKLSGTPAKIKGIN